MIGAIIGDIVGSIYEFNNIKTKDFDLFNKNAFFTDDTVMTIAVADICNSNDFSKDNIISTLKHYGRKYPGRGYGGNFGMWLNSNSIKPYYSYGNGSAMRISPVGFYAKTMEEVIELSRKITEVTHNHKEGLKGAEVTAMSIYYARCGKDKEFIKNYVSSIYPEILKFDYIDLVNNYRFNETCQDTVPQAIYCFLISNDFVDCLRTSISIGGDSDTLSCISCSIAEAYYKDIPSELVEYALSKLPKEFKELLLNDKKTNY